MNMKALLYLFWFEFYDQDLVYMDRRPDRQSDSLTVYTCTPRNYAWRYNK